MPIDERLRSALPAALDDVRPDVDATLAAVLRRAERRSRARRTAYGVGLAAAAVIAAVTLGLGGDESQRSVDPVSPTGEVPVLDSALGSADDPASLDAGRYRLPIDDGIVAEVQVPDGWGQDRWMLATGPSLDSHLRRIEHLSVDRVAEDPCDGNMQEVRPRVTDIVAALTRQRIVQPSEPQPVSIDGHSGQLVQFRVPFGLNVARCWDGETLRPFGLANSWTEVYPGWTYRTWVLEVEGDPLVILAAHGPDTTPSELAELTAIVEGITFVKPR